MYKLIKEAEKEIEIKELKNKLEKLADDDFYHEMKDHWTQDDFNKSDRISKDIKDVISSLEKLGVKATYKLGYPIEYSDELTESEITKEELDQAVKDEFINVYGYPKDVSPEFDDDINPEFYADIKMLVKNRLEEQKKNQQRKNEEKDYKRYKRELETLRKNHSTDVDYIDFLFHKIKDYENKYLNESVSVADSLALDILDFLKDYDIYEYRNNYSDDEEAYNDIVADPDAVISYLKDIFTNNETTPELSNRAKSLYLKLTQGTDDIDLINAGREPDERITEASTNSLSDDKLKNLYYMDRVLRSMNDENALSDGWLMNYVADGDSDNGMDYIINEYKNIITDEDYENAYNYYKSLVKDNISGGIISKKFYQGKSGYKPTAGASEDEIKFVKKDFPNIKIIETDEAVKNASYLGKERLDGIARLKSEITADLKSSGLSLDSLDFTDVLSTIDRIGEAKVNNKIYKKEDYLNDKDIMDYLNKDYSGKRISRRIADEKNPDSIVSVSNSLNIDLYELIGIIENMCHLGLASEVEDGIYLIK